VDRFLMPEPKKPGRPPLEPNQRSADVHVSLPAHTYDRVYEHAAKARTSVPHVIRQLVDRAFQPERQDV
jgi:hypothetical protein